MEHTQSVRRLRTTRILLEQLERRVAMSGDVTATGIDITARTGIPTIDLELASFHGPLNAIQGVPVGAQVDWGDGSAPTPELLGGVMGLTPADFHDNLFTAPVEGRHTYTAAGKYPIHVSMTVNGVVVATSTSTATVSDNADVPDGSVKGIGFDFHAQPGVAVDATLATFAGPISAFTAQRLRTEVDWGDGSSPENLLAYFTSISGDTFSYPIQGTHTYASAGSYTVHVTLIVNDQRVVTTSSMATVAVTGDPGGASGPSTTQNTLPTAGSGGGVAPGAQQLAALQREQALDRWIDLFKANVSLEHQRNVLRSLGAHVKPHAHRPSAAGGQHRKSLAHQGAPIQQGHHATISAADRASLRLWLRNAAQRFD